MSEAISPDELFEKLGTAIPDKVIEIVNTLLIEKAVQRGKTVHVTLHTADIVPRVMSAMDCSRHVVFEKQWLDFEPVFRRKGWKVKYTRGDWTETFDPYWEFEARAKSSSNDE